MKIATRNLANEGISSDKVRQVGDVLSALVVNDGSAKDLRR